MTVGIIEYGAGNVYSVQKAIERLGAGVIISSLPGDLSIADKLIFPGVGHAGSALKNLEKTNLISFIKNYGRPFLGICLGMQLMGSFLEEAGRSGLALFEANVVRFRKNKIIPHMGWNELQDLSGALFKGIPEQTDFYFVHSFYMELNNYTIAKCSYGEESFSAAVQKNNFFGVQFHPEKSGKWGRKLLENFLYLEI